MAKIIGLCLMLTFTYAQQDLVPLTQQDASSIDLNRIQPNSGDKDRKLSDSNASDIVEQMRQLQKQMRDEMDSFMSGSLGTNFFQGSFFNTSNKQVKIVNREDTKYKYVDIMLNGVDKNDVAINIENGAIKLKIEKRVKEENQENGTQSTFSSFSSMSQSTNVPFDVDADKLVIDAKDDKIVLKFPKKL